MAFNKAKALQEAEKSLSQGKTSQAIKQYLQILEKEPADLGLLNTIGDLYVREKNVSEALKHFYKLADSYAKEGFTVKAIAIYKKVTKLDPNAVDVMLKTGELYTVQGLAREAREQYAQAIDFFRKKNQNDKALEAYRKLAALDPENPAYRAKLADFCEHIGKKAEAAQAYAEAAEVAIRRGDFAAAEPALKKASSLDAKNPQVQLLRARMALRMNHADEAVHIVQSAPNLKSSPLGQRLLLDAYLASHNAEAAEKVVLSVYRASPADFAPLSAYASLCIGKGDYDAALAPLSEVADSLIEQKNTAPLMELLKQIWSKDPQHFPTLELILKISEKTADEATLPEVLEALGHACTQAGDVAKAEAYFQKLVSREPANETYKGLLKQVHQKQGKEVAAPAATADFAGEIALTAEPEAVAQAPAPAVAGPPTEEEAAAVKEALDNSDLYSRYSLVDKAVVELEKVLATYPDQVEIHNRIFEICQKGSPARAAQAAEALSRIYAQQGDSASARKYQQMAGTRAAPSAPKVAEAAPPPPPSPAPAAEFDLSMEFPGVAAGSPSGPAPQQSSAAPAQEFDLSTEFGAPSAPTETAPAAPHVPGFNFDESKMEVDYYMEQGFVDEARRAVETLEAKFPGNPQVAELRGRVEKLPPPKPPAPEAPPPAPAPPAFTPPAPPTPYQSPRTRPAAGPSAPPAPPRRVPAPVPPPDTSGPRLPTGRDDLLGSLAGELADSLAGIEQAAPPPPSVGAQGSPSSGAAASPGSPAALSGLLEELGEGADSQAGTDDPQTHYDLGVAFREMSLLDEAIGEFQKVVKGAQKGKFPPNFLQACTLLALCFMDKKMPAIATKWYQKALELPNLDEEAILALQYDLGVAFEQSGDKKSALEKFSEVYSQNIDYRDVAEKIRLLQQKA